MGQKKITRENKSCFLGGEGERVRGGREKMNEKVMRDC